MFVEIEATLTNVNIETKNLSNEVFVFDKPSSIISFYRVDSSIKIDFFGKSFKLEAQQGQLSIITNDRDILLLPLNSNSLKLSTLSILQYLAKKELSERLPTFNNIYITKIGKNKNIDLYADKLLITLKDKNQDFFAVEIQSLNDGTLVFSEINGETINIESRSLNALSLEPK